MAYRDGRRNVRPIERGEIMTIITIENRYDMMIVHEGVRLQKSRLEWRGPGIEIYLKGSFKTGYDVAANLAMNYAQSIHIQISSIRRAI